MCAKTDRTFTMLRHFKRSRPSVCPSKVPFLTDEELRCANKKVESLLKEKASSSNELRGKCNDYTPEERARIGIRSGELTGLLEQFGIARR